jgi:hypothetical protein
MIILVIIYLYIQATRASDTGNSCVNTTNYPIPSDFYGNVLDPCEDGDCWTYCDHTMWHNMSTGGAIISQAHLDEEQAECIETACTHFYYARADIHILELCASVKCHATHHDILNSRNCSRHLADASDIYKYLEEKSQYLEDLTFYNRSIVEIQKNAFINSISDINTWETTMRNRLDDMLDGMTSIINVKDPEVELHKLETISATLTDLVGTSDDISNHLSGTIDGIHPIMEKLKREELHTAYQRTIARGLMLTKEYMDLIQKKLPIIMVYGTDVCIPLDTLLGNMTQECYICSYNGTCSYDLTSNYQCACDVGFHGDFCELEMRVCADGPCIHDGICQDEFDTFRCECTDDWIGTFCHIPVIDACDDMPCQHGGTCHSNNQTHRNYTCECLFGFVGNNCQTALQECPSINECTNGHCVFNNHRAACQCPIEPIYAQPFWTGDFCQHDQQECNYYQTGYDIGSILNGAPCNGHGECSMDYAANKMRCECDYEFRGARCEFRIQEPDVCAFDYNVLCEHGSCSHCSGWEGNCSCLCEPGWEGIQCHRDIDECLGNPCISEAPCTNLKNDYYCDCAAIPGKRGGKNCLATVDCTNAPCGGYDQFSSCNDDAPTISGIECTCKPGYVGERCEIDAHTCNERVCLNGGVCMDGFPHSFCNCPLGFSGSRCEKLPAFCASEPCGSNGKCITFADRYECRCFDGWDGPQCNHNIDDCAPNQCFRAKRCVDKVNAFECVCEPGWHGRLCNHMDSPCDSVTCYNHGVCIDTRNHEWTNSDFACACVNGYYGNYCRISRMSIWLWLCVSGVVLLTSAGIYLLLGRCYPTNTHHDEPRKKRTLMMA